MGREVGRELAEVARLLERASVIAGERDGLSTLSYTWCDVGLGIILAQQAVLLLLDADRSAARDDLGVTTAATVVTPLAPLAPLAPSAPSAPSAPASGGSPFAAVHRVLRQACAQVQVAVAAEELAGSRRSVELDALAGKLDELASLAADQVDTGMIDTTTVDTGPTDTGPTGRRHTDTGSRW